MAEIQSTRFTQFYRRLASLKEAFTADLQESILPTAELLFPAQSDLARDRGENFFGLTTNITGAVGLISQLWIAPPAGVLFAPVWIATQNVTAPGVPTLSIAALTDAPGALGLRVVPTDTRALSAPPSAANLPQGATNWGAFTAAAIGPNRRDFGFVLGNLSIAPMGIVLVRPDTALVIYLPTANQSMNVCVIGYERHFEIQESF